MQYFLIQFLQTSEIRMHWVFFFDHEIWTYPNNVRHDLFQLSDETVIVYGIVFQSILFIVVQKNMNIFYFDNVF